MPDFEYFDEDPGIDGPDYVALVIEWPEEAATTEIADEVTRPTRASRFQVLVRALSLHKGIVALGAAIALAATAWSVHRLRAPC